MEPKVPIMLITGTLGSGKTTLLKRILQNARQRIAVIMNEFGEVSIDSKILEGDHLKIIDVSGGCVCCSMTGEFEAAIRELVETIRPEFIVLESSGVAEADALVLRVGGGMPQVRIDSVVYVVDAYAVAMYPYIGMSARSHIESADIILINKTDLISLQEAEQVETAVREYNPRAIFFRTAGCEVDTNLLFGLEVERRPRMGGPFRDMTTFESVSFATGKPLGEQRFRELVRRLPSQVYRAKGFVRLDGRGFLFNYVAGRSDLEEFSSDETRLVFIGRGVKAVGGEILQGLRACEVS